MTTAATSGDSFNNNSSNNTSPASFNLAGETASLTTTGSSSSLLTSSRDRCRRCNQLVYVTERIGPVKDYLYHKLCFKCLKCDRQLDFKTYFTNSDDLNDKEIYCQSHAPRSGKGVFSAGLSSSIGNSAVCLVSGIEASAMGLVLSPFA